MCSLMEDVCYNYLTDVYKNINPKEYDNSDWWVETFLFEATNNFKDGEYDIIRSNSLSKINIDKIVKDNIFEIIKYVNTYLEDNYGEETILKWKELNVNYLVRNYCYVYGHLNIDELKQKLEKI